MPSSDPHLTTGHAGDRAPSATLAGHGGERRRVASYRAQMGARRRPYPVQRKQRPTRRECGHVWRALEIPV